MVLEKNKSTELAAITLMEEVRRSVDWVCIVGPSFLDLSKSFDTIRNAKVVSDLMSNGVNGSELEWFIFLNWRDYLFNREVQVMHDKCLSQSKPLFSGVPQSSILGPFVFVIFSNHIVLELTQSKIIK